MAEVAVYREVIERHFHMKGTVSEEDFHEVGMRDWVNPYEVEFTEGGIEEESESVV